MNELMAGTARAILTPPVGIPMAGFAGRGPALAIHDNLIGTALALQSGERRAVLITADLLYFDDRLTSLVRDEVERRTGVSGRDVLLCAAHNHYGPARPSGDTNPTDPAEEILASYQANLRHLLAGAAEEAFSCLTPVTIAAGRGETRIGVNRRQRLPDGRIILGSAPDRPCDRDVPMLRIDALDGHPVALLVNAACHPVSQAHATREISADYVGEMRRVVETETGSVVLFLQGAAGNINPIEMRHSFEPVRRLGRMLGGDVLRCIEEIGPGGDAPDGGEGFLSAGIGTSGSDRPNLAIETVTIDLPARGFSTREEGEARVAEMEEERRGLLRSQAENGSLWWIEHRLDLARRMLSAVSGGADLPSVSAEVSVLRMDWYAIVTTPGEPFCEIGMEVKRRSPFQTTLFAGYANGSIGYVPVPDAYPEGGYEVTHACRVGPVASGLLVDAAVGLLARLSS